MEGYSVTIAEMSKELSAIERVKLKDMTRAAKLDELTADGASCAISPEMYAVLDIHNEKSENKDYKVLVILDKDGTKYTTGSPSFMDSFLGIWKECDGEEFDIECYKMPSKNYKGKDFLTCSIV